MHCQTTDWCKLTLLCDESISTSGNWMCKPYEYNFLKISKAPTLIFLGGLLAIMKIIIFLCVVTISTQNSEFYVNNKFYTSG